MVRLSFFLATAGALAGCDQMYEQVSVRPGEAPQFLPSTGTVARSEFELPETNPLQPTSATLAAGKTLYRQYCWPCHGPRFDGQSATVGPSFPRGNLNLLDPAIVQKSDAHYFRHTTLGSELAPRFAGVLTVKERWQVITYLRAVQAQGKP